METAILINDIAAKRVMGRVPYTPGRRIHMRPIYKRHSLQGYAVILNGAALTENQIAAMGV